MSTPESGAMIVRYTDGRTDRVERMDRPGVLIRLERAYPDVDLAAGVGERAEHLLFIVYTALRIDHPIGDPLRPGDDLLEWADTLEGIPEPADPPEDEAAAPAVVVRPPVAVPR